MHHLRGNAIVAMLMQLEMNFKKVGLQKYMSTTNDWMVQSILFYDAEEKAYSMSKQGSKE